MFIAIFIGWCILVFGGYAYCVIRQIEAIFYLWLAFAVIGGVFVCMDGLQFSLGSNYRSSRSHGNIEADKHNVSARRKAAQKQSPFSDLLSYMTIPLIICILCDYLIF